MGQALIVDALQSDAGTLYNLSNPSTEAPGTNLQTIQPKEVYEITSVSGNQDIHIDLGTSASYDTIALLFTNLTTSATWTLDVGTNGATFGTSILGSTTFAAAGQADFTRRHGFYVHSSTITTRFLRIRLADSGNSDGLMRLGRLVIGKAYRFYVNAGATIGYADNAETIETMAGERIPHIREAIPTASFTLTESGSSAWAAVQVGLFERFRRLGAAYPVLYIQDPSDSSYAGRLMRYGTMQPGLELSLTHPFEYYEAAIQITGMI